MNAVLGHLGVWLGFAASLVGLAVAAFGLLGGPRAADGTRARPAVGLLDARPYAPVVLLGAVVAVVAMEHALDHPRLHASPTWPTTTPGRRRSSTRSPGLWSALAGSILLWGLMLAVFGVALVWCYRRRAADPSSAGPRS